MNYTYKNSLGQGHALAFLLFNVALENTVRDIDIQTNHIIIHEFYKFVQLLEYTDDTDIIARCQPSPEGAARRM
jgi:hypothetical protein